MNENHSAAIAATLAAITARSEANRARQQATEATDPAARAALDQQAAEADARALDAFDRAGTAATAAGNQAYAHMMREVTRRITPTDPTSTPDPLDQAAQAIEDAANQIAGDLAPLYRMATEALAPMLAERSHPNPEHQRGHEFYAVEITPPTPGPDMDGQPTAAVVGRVVHLRTHAGDIYEVLDDLAAPVELARACPTQVLAIVNECHATNEEGQRKDGRAVLIICPFGLRVRLSTYDPKTREWIESGSTWHETGDDLEKVGPLAHSLGKFYAVEMIAAQIIGRRDDDNQT